ncbi:hypothetical protein RMATCC62417_13358 [Rhizopus microsporus]|nr:hypothetical protein RMATCC62417_13358 [Rhizopus microsporus]
MPFAIAKVYTWIHRAVSNGPNRRYGVFSHYGAVLLASLEHRLDPTVRFLYQISKELMKKKSNPNDKSAESMESFLEKIKRRIENVADEDENTRGSTVKQIEDCVSESLELISEQSKLLERKKTAYSNQNSINDNKYTESDIYLLNLRARSAKIKTGNTYMMKEKYKDFSSHTHHLTTSRHHVIIKYFIFKINATLL